jgi:hypothetical protein
MSLIQNKTKGTYLFLCTKTDPADSSITLKHEIGINAVVAPSHCRFVHDDRFKKNKHVYIAIVSKHQPGGKPVSWISQEIGPGEFWIFDGRKLQKSERKPKLASDVSHGM